MGNKSGWLGITVMVWGLIMWGLALIESEIVLNYYFFFGSLIIWGMFVFLLLELNDILKDRKF